MAHVGDEFALGPIGGFCLMLGIRQRSFRLFAFGNIVERHHRPDDVAVLLYRRAGVFDREGGAVLAPVDVIRNLPENEIFYGFMGRAIVRGKIRAIGPGMMNGIMKILAEQFLALVAQHLSRSRIDESDLALPVNTTQSLSGRDQNHLASSLRCFRLMLGLLQRLLDQALLGGLRDIGDQLRTTIVVDDRGQDIAVNDAPAVVPERNIAEFPATQTCFPHILIKSLNDFWRVQFQKRKTGQFVRLVAEHSRESRVAGDDAMGGRIHHENALAGLIEEILETLFRFSQTLFRLFAFGNIVERHHRPDDVAVVLDRRTAVFNREG